MPTYGIVLRLTHTGTTNTSIPINDVAIVEKGSPISKNVYVPLNGTIDLAYGGLVPYSFETGTIRSLINAGLVNATIIQGSEFSFGPTGPAGIDGPTGPQGQIGLPGQTGPTGSAGILGPAGPTGLEGPAGPTGGSGIEGPTGPTGLSATLGVTAGTYGDVSNIPQITVDVNGQITSIVEQNITSTSILTLYVSNATGSDSNDGLTLLTPKKSIQAAVDAVGLFLAAATSPNAHATINVAAQSTVEDFNVTGTYAGRGLNASPLGILIQGATPTILSGPHTLTSVSLTDPDNTVVGSNNGAEGTITVLGAGWTVNAYAGKFVRIQGGATTTYAPISSNTSDTLTVMRQTGGSLGFSVGNTIEIVQPSTIMTGGVAVNSANLQIRVNDFQIIGTAGTPPIRTIAAGVLGFSTFNLQRCIIDFSAYTGVGWACSSQILTTCQVVAALALPINMVIGVGGIFSASRTYFKNLARMVLRDSRYSSFLSCVVDGLSNAQGLEPGDVCRAQGFKYKNNSGPFAIRGEAGFGNGNNLQSALFTSSGTSVTHILLITASGYNLEGITFINGAIGINATLASQASGIATTLAFSGTLNPIVADGASAVAVSAIQVGTGATTGISVLGASRLICDGNVDFTGTTNPIVLRDGSTLVTRGTLSGTGNVAQPLVIVNDGSRFVCAATPTLSGGSSDLRFDGTTKAFTDMPFANAVGSAASVRSA
jgi:hypothetical protein